MKRAVIYARVSMDAQRENTSIPDQIKTCRDYIAKRGYSLVGQQCYDPMTGMGTNAPDGIPAFVDDFPGESYPRPAITDALEYYDDYGFDVIVIKHPDRFSRGEIAMQLAKYEFTQVRDAKIEFVEGGVSDNEDGEFIEKFHMFIASAENIRRAKRSKDGKMEKARRSLFVGGRAPYGYEIDIKSPGGLAVIEDQAVVVKTVFNWFVNEDESIRGVAERLSKTNYRPHQGGDTWQKSTIQKILRNPVYTGVTYYNKLKLYRNKLQNTRILKNNPQDLWIKIEGITPIIDQDTFTEAQRKLESNKAIKYTKPDRFYLLSGMVVCADCGRPYVSQTALRGRSRRAEDAQSYRHRAREGACMNRQISARILEPAVWEMVKSLLLEPEQLRKGYEQTRSKEREGQMRELAMKDELTRNFNKLETRKQNLLKAYTDPDIGLSKAEFISQRQMIDTEMESTTERLREIDSHLSQTAAPLQFESIERFSKEIRSRLTDEDWKPTPANMRKIIDLLHARVMITREGEALLDGWFSDSPATKTRLNYDPQRPQLPTHA